MYGIPQGVDRVQDPDGQTHRTNEVRTETQVVFCCIDSDSPLRTPSSVSLSAITASRSRRALRKKRQTTVRRRSWSERMIFDERGEVKYQCRMGGKEKTRLIVRMKGLWRDGPFERWTSPGMSAATRLRLLSGSGEISKLERRRVETCALAGSVQSRELIDVHFAMDRRLYLERYLECLQRRRSMAPLAKSGSRGGRGSSHRSWDRFASIHKLRFLGVTQWQDEEVVILITGYSGS